MQITNNDKVGKWFFYKVNGQTKKVNVPGQTSVQLPDLISMNQVIRNGYDVKVDHINSLLNRGLTGDFTVANTAPIDYHLLDTWYASLSVKPSAGLWTDLQALANGIKSDGDWDEIDLAGMIACMETEEQSLKPLKTTSTSGFTKVGSPIIDASGARNPNPGTLNYINSNWNPFSNGSKYTLNNGFLGVYGDTYVTGNTTAGAIFSSSDTINALAAVLPYMLISLRNDGYINSASQGSTAVKTVTAFAGQPKRYFGANYRTNATQQSSYINGNRASGNSNSVLIPNYKMFILASNEAGTPIADTENIARFVITGSGNINPDRIANRLNNFFSSRGLTITNY